MLTDFPAAWIAGGTLMALYRWRRHALEVISTPLMATDRRHRLLDIVASVLAKRAHEAPMTEEKAEPISRRSA